jgi:hypothetical protein
MMLFLAERPKTERRRERATIEPFFYFDVVDTERDMSTSQVWLDLAVRPDGPSLIVIWSCVYPCALIAMLAAIAVGLAAGKSDEYALALRRCGTVAGIAVVLTCVLDAVFNSAGTRGFAPLSAAVILVAWTKTRLAVTLTIILVQIIYKIPASVTATLASSSVFVLNSMNVVLMLWVVADQARRECAVTMDVAHKIKQEMKSRSAARTPEECALIAWPSVR